jgi:hypothetical protein
MAQTRKILTRLMVSTPCGRSVRPRDHSARLPEEPDLPQHGGVVPVNALTGQFPPLELHDDHDIDINLFVRRQGVRQKPRHGLTVGERDVEFIHQLAFPDDLVDARHPEVVRLGRDEVIPVEAA